MNEPIEKGYVVLTCKCKRVFVAFNTVKVKLCPDCKDERYHKMQRDRYNPNRKAKRKASQVTE